MTLTFEETKDWLRIAAQVRNELERLNPSKRTAVDAGAAKLPALRVKTTKADALYVMVHPLWSTDSFARAGAPFADILATTDVEVYFVDTFVAGRRPVKALEIAKERPTYR